MVLMYKVLAFVIFQIFPLKIIANNSIPDQLFGINLGKHKEINASNLNVKKIESCMRSLSFMGFPLGASYDCYFEPKDRVVSDRFPYISSLEIKIRLENLGISLKTKKEV